MRVAIVLAACMACGGAVAPEPEPTLTAPPSIPAPEPPAPEVHGCQIVTGQIVQCTAASWYTADDVTGYPRKCDDPKFDCLAGEACTVGFLYGADQSLVGVCR